MFLFSEIFQLGELVDDILVGFLLLLGSAELLLGRLAPLNSQQ